MKKRLFFILLGILLLTGCNKKIDYSKYSFTSTSCVRDNGHDTETLTLHADGRFNYSCACGNPVNDSDLCENYIYDDKNNEINLDCYAKGNETITKIKVLKSTSDILELDFNGDVRAFTKEE